MNPFEKVLRGVDRTQRRTGPLAFAFAVNKKFGDDQAGNLAALITYYGFLTLFPALLILVTVLGIVAGGSSSIQHRVLHSVLAQFPVIGNTSGPLSLASNIHRLRRNSPIGLGVGLLGLVWGAIGSVQNGQYAMAQVWNVPQRDRPGFVPRTLRSLAVLVVMFVFVVLSAGLTGVTTFSGSQGPLWRALAVLGSLVVACGLMVAVFRLLTPKQIATGQLVFGALAAGVAWTALQAAGTWLLDHELRGMSQVYGLFAIVLGALWWIYLVARVVLYAAEVNVVRARRLWPRSMVQPPLTEADQRMLETYPHQEERRPEVEVSARVRDG